MMVLAGQFRRAMRRVLGVIEVKNNRRWRLGGAGHAGVNQRMREAGEIGARHAMCEPGEGRSTRHVLARLKRDAFDAQLAPGSVPETLGLIALRIARRDVRDALGEEVSQQLGNRRGMVFGAFGSGHAFREADRSVEATEAERPKGGRQGAPVTISPYSVPSNGRKTALFRCRIRQTQTSWGLYGIDASHTLFYQRLARGLCFFMHNPG